MTNHILLFAIALSFLLAGCSTPNMPPKDAALEVAGIRILSPTADCPVEEPRPAFSWTPYRQLGQRIVYGLQLVELQEKQDARKALAANARIIDQADIRSAGLRYPERLPDLRPGKVYAFQVAAYQEGGSRLKPLAQSEIAMFYLAGERLPAGLQALLCCEQNLLEEQVDSWKAAYGNPTVNSRQMGCFQNTGIVEMAGSRSAGDAIQQPAAIKKGNRYQLSFCARAYPKQLDYIRFRVLAFNGSLPASGTHPQPNADIAVVGESANIAETGWARCFLSSWQAPKDYAHIAILAIADENAPEGVPANGALSGICLQLADGCGLTAADLGVSNPEKLPEEIGQALQPGSTPETPSIGFDQGALVDLFGYPFDEAGNSNWYAAGDDCISIGGWLPPEAEDKEKEETNFKLPGGLPLDAFEEGMKKYYDLFGFNLKFPDWGPIPPEKEQDCRNNYDKNKPFSGRDIIYVHGFRPDHVYQNIVKSDRTGYLGAVAGATGFLDPAALDDALTQKWPEAEEEFFEGGFYHREAKDYFYPHIQHFLGDTLEPSNRFLVIAYNSSQRLIDNVHSVYTQISRAMNEGVGVVAPENDPRGAECFGWDYVIVTHSTGALVMDAAMSLAGLSGADGNIQQAFGDVQYIARRAKTQISLHGAIAGSELAGLAVIGANVAAVTATAGDVGVDVQIAVDNSIDSGMQMVVDALTGMNTAGTTNNTDAFEAFMDAATDSAVVIAQNTVNVVNNSILVDLTPVVAKLLWGPFLNQTTVPVLTVAGGHPGSIDHSLATKWVLPGLDDGVVNVNSQSGSPSLLYPDSYAYLPPGSRIYDMGIAVQRAATWFAEQYRSPALAAYGSFPFLAPDGMVQPVAIAPSPSPRYSNHFPFIQSTAEHNHPMAPTGPYFSTFGAANTEESLVAENNFMFSSGLVNPAILPSMRQRVRGQDLILTFSFTYPVFSFPPPGFNWQTISFSATVPLWRRSYRQLSDGWKETDYVYRFVLR